MTAGSPHAGGVGFLVQGSTVTRTVQDSGFRTYANPVPEPGSIALVGLGLAGLLVARRRLAA